MRAFSLISSDRLEFAVPPETLFKTLRPCHRLGLEETDEHTRTRRMRDWLVASDGLLDIPDEIHQNNANPGSLDQSLPL